jgi:hypothetical protein
LGTKPREKGSKFLDLDNVELLIDGAILDEREEDGAVGRRIHGNEIGSIRHTGSGEAGSERSKSRRSSVRNGLTKKDGEDMLESIDIRSSDRNHEEYGRRDVVKIQREEEGG